MRTRQSIETTKAWHTAQVDTAPACGPSTGIATHRAKPGRLFLSPPHMGGHELGFINEAFASNYIAPLGPIIDAFEQEFAACVGIPHCLALASGTAAMHLALRELGVGPGDEVLASTLTFIGSVSPATFLGAKLAFIDADPKTWNLDPVLLAEELAACAKRGRMPKVVIPTDLYGQCADLNRIKEVCKPYGIPVVVDAAEAMGARYWQETHQISPETSNNFTSPDPELARSRPRPRNQNDDPMLGDQADDYEDNSHDPATQIVQLCLNETAEWHHAGYGAKAAIFSFNGNKIITSSGGGMLASEDAALIEHARKLSQQARDPAPYYEHTEIGYNYRMSNVVAAIGRGQLRVLEDRVVAKHRIFEAYRELLNDLPGIEFMPESAYGRSNRWLTVLCINPERFGATNEQVRLALEAENIESRPVWKPMHLQPVFRDCRVRGGKVSEQLFRDGLCLPSGTAMTDSDLERVAAVIHRCA